MGVAVLLAELLLLARKSASSPSPNDGVGDAASSVNIEFFLELGSLEADELRLLIRSSALRIFATGGRRPIPNE